MKQQLSAEEQQYDGTITSVIINRTVTITGTFWAALKTNQILWKLLNLIGSLCHWCARNILEI